MKKPDGVLKPIEFVYFDLGNVLASFDVERACQNVAQRWNVDPAIVRQTLWASGAQDRFEHGHVDDEAFAAIAREGLGLGLELAPTKELLDLLSDMFEPVAEMEKLVDDVRHSGTKLGILSNTCAAHWRWILECDYPSLRGPFHQVVLSYELGVMKPNLAIYQAAEESAAVEPDAILFLDDRADNVAAALSCGWQACLFTDAKSARELLRYRGVLE